MAALINAGSIISGVNVAVINLGYQEEHGYASKDVRSDHCSERRRESVSILGLLNCSSIMSHPVCIVYQGLNALR